MSRMVLLGGRLVIFPWDIVALGRKRHHVVISSFASDNFFNIFIQVGHAENLQFQETYFENFHLLICIIPTIN